MSDIPEDKIKRMKDLKIITYSPHIRNGWVFNFADGGRRTKKQAIKEIEEQINLLMCLKSFIENSKE
ncbi:MAG: hypothetical protein CBC24_03965 [Candidatus Pelagibacter sp. TMED64]|nr:MAG: hypothetical protein CBC24_03965 [Candidatus Pelagibacter sp. TMED64]|tara:strand:+ start:601 stop:801 length:201 start_codon:yes stop_codon:yes gene_type:complete